MQLNKIKETTITFFRNIWNHPFFDWLPYKRFVTITAALGLVFIIINVAMAGYYQNRFYPNTHIGSVQVGGLTEVDASYILMKHATLQPVALAFDKDLVTIPSSELGVTYDIDQTIQQARNVPRPLLPIVSLLPEISPASSVFVFSVEQEVMEAKLKEVLKDKSTEPINAEIKINEGQVELVPHKAGREYELESVAAQVKESLAQLSPEPFPVQAEVVEPEVSSRDLQEALQQIRQKLALNVTLSYQDAAFSPTPDEIGAWLRVNDQHQVEVDSDAISRYVQSLAEQVNRPVTNRLIVIRNGQEEVIQEGQAGVSMNQEEVVAVITSALENNQPVEAEASVVTVEPATIRPLQYLYCVTANQVNTSKLDHFSGKISTTLADSRGWGLGGRILFQKVDSGCSFTLILAAAHTLPGYSSGCSVHWSCRVGSQVIINVDRWEGASDSWNQAGGNLDNYQSMVINHEVGHWLGFDHWSCGGPGQSAPVMLQQSISLQGCTFNPWPLESELNQLRTMKGL